MMEALEGALSRCDEVNNNKNSNNNNNNTGDEDGILLFRRLIATALARRVCACCGRRGVTGDVAASRHLLTRTAPTSWASLIRTKQVGLRAREKIAKHVIDLQCNGFDCFVMVRNHETNSTWIQCSQCFWNKYKVKSREW